MATRQASGLIGGQDTIDTIDMVALVAFPIVAGVVFGIWTLQIDVFGGFSLADVMFHIGDTGVTYGMLVALAAVGWIVATNEIDVRV